MKGREAMNNLLIFFALPIAVIIISIALQKILKCPVLVAAIIFAIFLIVTFVINNLNFLIAAIVYAVISLVTAYITCIVSRFLCDLLNSCSCCNRDNQCRCNNNNLITVRNVANTNANCGCNQNQEQDGCMYQITNSDGLSARINVIPNTSNNNDCNNTNQSCCRRR